MFACAKHLTIAQLASGEASQLAQSLRKMNTLGEFNYAFLLRVVFFFSHDVA